ncbi:peptidoglycan-binding protein [Variovorax sp. J22P240]|uniref:XVIPCD domain-containing protein n=1 Tax=Variovorax sp. J22P240 TaxID=3053514 RepID=UPI0025772E84|nr:XVIPCD domain-containing protein [Variovorax sp. J22P240]MDL9998455.1 peptidoglycan-binding protein [Variovorax sp. J22P240]
MTRDRETQVLMAAMSAGVKSPKELANFMAQVTHESSDLKRLEEGFRYTKGISQIPVESALREGSKALEAARLEALRGNPERLADLMYGGRMGNSDTGDGFKYRGRGYIQLTGKNGYREAGDALGLDLVKDPDLAADPGNAAKIAAWYWNKNVHRVAPENVIKATHVINNGENGLKDRKARFAQWEQRLTPEVFAHLAQGETRLTELAEKHPQSKAAPHQAEVAFRQGAHGHAVVELQAQLKALGYTDAHGRTLQADGHFGANTRHAVEAFQRDSGLPVNGIAARHTLSGIHEANPPQTTARTTACLNDASHADHALFKQAQRGVHEMDAKAGRTPDQRSDNLAAALVVAARSDGMSRIDHVSLGTDASKVFAVQGALNSPFKQITSVPTVESLNTPVAQSTQAWDRAMQQATSQRLEQHASQPTHQTPRQQAQPSLAQGH